MPRRNNYMTNMKSLSSPTPESGNISGKMTQFSAECWFHDDTTCILDMDYFVKTLSGIKAKGVRPDLIGSIITHYASKWLPDLSPNQPMKNSILTNTSPETSTSSVNASLMKKRFFVETLIGILPPDRDSIPCNFLLRLLRNANMVGAEQAYRAELEKRIAWKLDEASLKELMIPSFTHTCEVLLDVELVLRLVKRFVISSLDEAFRSGAALIKVAKLVDSYLAEVAVDSGLTLPEFVALAGALPAHARSIHDGLYRAIDTYLKAHPGVGKLERKDVCKLLDCRKLSPEASLHAAQNQRLPVRAVIQVLFSEQAKLNWHIDWSGSFGGGRRASPNLNGLEPRSQSKRAMTVEQIEIKRLKEDVVRLQWQCQSMQAQIERVLVLEKKKIGFFSNWKKLGIIASVKPNTSSGIGIGIGIDTGAGAGAGADTGTSNNNKLVRNKTCITRRRRSSMS